MIYSSEESYSDVVLQIEKIMYLTSICCMLVMV